MKKLACVFALMVGLMASTIAQRATLFPLAAGDTVSAVAGMDTVTKVITVTAGYSALGVQVVATKLTGTPAGKAYVYSSLDGVNYNLTDSSAAFTDITTNVAFFSKVTTPNVFYKIQVRPMGQVSTTQTTQVRVYYVLRKHN